MPLWVLLLALFLLNLAGLRFLGAAEDMATDFENHDTRVIVAALRSGEKSLGEYFVGDWALGNGFYRPLPSVAYAADEALWGDDFPMYKIQTWIYPTLVAFTLFFFVAQLTGRRGFAWACAMLFSGWQTGVLQPMDTDLWVRLAEGAALLALVGVLVYGAWRKERGWLWWLGTAALGFLLIRQIVFVFDLRDLHMKPFAYRAMGWPPGRTATMMSLFALLSLGGFCAHARTRRLAWLGLTLAGLVGAILCYEQAIVIPALLIGCAWWLRSEGARPAWSAVAVAVAIVGAYAAWHTATIQADTDYRNQREKGWRTASTNLGPWVFPTPRDSLTVQTYAEQRSPAVLLVPALYVSLSVMVAVALGLWVGWRSRARQVTFGYLGSFVAFAPLSFVLPLMHYAYFPAAIRTVFVVALAEAFWRRWGEIGGPMPGLGNRPRVGMRSPL